MNALPDGYTLLLVGASSAINATLYEKLSFNFLRDITPVAGVISIPFIMAVNPSFPAKTVSEFIAYARANPGKINVASGGQTERQAICRANCSRRWPASTWSTFRIGARDRH